MVDILNETRVFAAQDALVALLAAALPAYRVYFGTPTDISLLTERDAFVSEDVRDWTFSDDVTYDGAELDQDESFPLTAFIYRRIVGANARDMRDAIAADLAAVAYAVRTDPTLTGTVSMARLSAGELVQSFFDAEGREREGQVKLTVTCAVYHG